MYFLANLQETLYGAGEEKSLVNVHLPIMSLRKILRRKISLLKMEIAFLRSVLIQIYTTKELMCNNPFTLTVVSNEIK